MDENMGMGGGLAATAQQGAMGDPAGNGAGGDEEAAAMLDEIVQLLLNGTDPQELLQHGVPPGLLKQAMEIVMAQEEAGATDPNANPQAPPPPDPMGGGLAARAMG